MHKTNLITFICLLSNLVFSQKEDFVWVSGSYIDSNSIINSYIFDFNNKPFAPEHVNTPLGFLGNNASICDRKGNLLFYTNGRAVINSHHQIMPNGDSINAGEWADKFWGTPIDGYPGSQDVMILTDPANENGFYLFHKTVIYYPLIKDSLQLHYTYVDMNLDNKLGNVVVKNKRYYEKENPMYFYFTAIQHANKKDWWIIQPIEEDSVYLTYLLDNNGINRMPDQNTHQYFNRWRSTASGMAKFSPDGTKYALYNYVDQLHIYDFDRETGLLSNHQKVYIYPKETIDANDSRFNGIEWSPNSRFIYTSSNVDLHQIDIWAENPQESIIHIDTYDGTLDPFQTPFNFMAQGPDCRIYVYPKNGSYSLHIINKPNELGKECNFVQNGIKLPNQNGNGTVPNFPRFRVDEEDKCDSTIVSVFGDKVYYRRYLEVYPNPNAGLFKIKLPEAIGKANLEVTNINGQVIFTKEINHRNIEEIDIGNKPSGRYNIEVYPLENRERVFYGKQVIKI